MKNIFLIISILSITNINAQKTYEFDYVIEYKLNIYKDSIKIKNHHYYKNDKEVPIYYLTNSNDNDYLAIITEKDSLNYRLRFTDYNGIYSDVIFLKTGFNNAEFINIKCENVIRFINPYKFRTKYYDFITTSDTIINEKSYATYKLKPIKPKITKRKKLGTNYYIIDKSTEFHLPILSYSAVYEEWKLKKNLPNGIFDERFNIDFYGNLRSKQKLIKYQKTDKKIIIQNECDYTKKKYR
ncbi:hypothetical protein [Lutibacter flavus]|uniref:GLPGLI family protein n=1 Tax=Lutibacter flavus TaxID=691689 RepID=A0A238VUS2_9FLAO|nr:hypothetical protein [Lutibacter flavus]SNR37931.1 hypothetical protein SAMN04488111_1053 [Lutibacter flavus]